MVRQQFFRRTKIFSNFGGLFNMGFGDLLPDGTVDDKANSNNGDIAKVMVTVIEILKHFTSQHPSMEIYFEGSTAERTKLYGRILKAYYPIFRLYHKKNFLNLLYAHN